jgi:hypothetical protein
MMNEQQPPARKPKTLDTEQLIAEDEEWLGDGALRELRDDSGD